MFRRLRRWLSSQKQTSHTRKQPVRFRPLVESLEDRLAPAILTVNSLADNVDHTNGVLTLREAVDAVNIGDASNFSTGEMGQISATLGDDDMIRFDNSLAGQTIVLTNGQLTLDYTVNVVAPSGGLTISGNNASRIFTINAGQEVTLSELTLTGGRGAGGGAILNNGILTILSCTFSGNTSTGGGGALTAQGDSSTNLVNSTFSGNSATVNGGALHVIQNATLTATHCTIVGNRADSDGNDVGTSGGVSRFSTATVILNSCIFTDNVRGAAGSDIPDDITASVDPSSRNNRIAFAPGLTGITDGTNGNQIVTSASTFLNFSVGPLQNNGGPTSTHALVPGSRSAINGNAGLSFLVTPATVASATVGGDFSPAQHLIDNSGLSGTPVVDTLASVTHAAAGSTNAWATTADGIDYFVAGTTPRLSFSLGATCTLTDLVVWGYDFSGDGPDDGNEAKQFRLQFSSDGGNTFPTTINVTRAEATGTSAERLSLGRSVTANFVRIDITDNFFDNGNNFSGGDRVALGEVKFIANAVVATPVLISPIAATSSTAATDAGNVDHLIVDSRLSAVPTLVNLNTITHTSKTGTGALTSWVTTSSGSYYFTAGPAPSLIFSLGATFNLTDLVVWGYDFVGDGANDDGEARILQLETSTDGGATFSAPFNITRTRRTGANVNVLSLLATVTANTVRINVLDNFFGESGGDGGGDRVALGQVKFIGTPANDQRGNGFKRVQVGLPDVGAFEVQDPTGNTIVVNNSDDELDGDISAGDLTLREAIAIANERPGADTITFAPGTSPVILALDELVLTDTAKTTINGGSGVTIQRSTGSGTGRFRIFNVQGGTVDFNNLTIRNGAGDLEGAPRSGGGNILNRFGVVTLNSTTVTGGSALNGGGINTTGGTLTVNSSSITGNSAFFTGGGLYNSNSTVTITNSGLSNNAATFFGDDTNQGGAIFNSNIGTMSITNAILASNVASGVGGAIVNAGSLTVVNSAFQSNQSTGFDGGAIHTTGPLTVTGSTFTGNTAVLRGGALSVIGSSSTRLINSTFSGNSAAANGGAINVNDSASMTATHCTIVLNRADSDGTGNGVSGAISRVSSATVTLNNCIVAGNLRGSDPGSNDDLSTTVASASSNNLIGDPNSAGGLSEGVNGNLVGNGSGFLLPVSSIVNLALSNNGGGNSALSHALVLNGRALNAGSNNLSVDATGNRLQFDQRGPGGVANFLRQVGSNVDIGAIEYIGPNQSPVNSVPATRLKLRKNRLFTFNGMLSVADPDAGAGLIRVSIAVAKGKLILDSANNVTIFGSNSKTMAMTGTVTAINAALAALQYKPNSSFIGTVKLTMTSEDLGNSGDSFLSDTDVLKLRMR